MVERYVREAKMLIATQEQSEIEAALGLLEAALALAPRMEGALELKPVFCFISGGLRRWRICCRIISPA
ncbi:UNVERIFIED_CONTAM: hypothetical protein Sangu_2514500 [Sesamum angustifolium]|uniref:Uncharacterized protein n=1 Tax=Sesamum angustifolium TaxID=2727405 RepID=A0AAW2JM27_9LAMI